MIFLKQLVVLSIIFLGTNLDAMEKTFHIEAATHAYYSDYDYGSKSEHQQDSGFSLISGSFNTNWEDSGNAPREAIDTEYQTHHDFALDTQREAMAEDYATQQRDKYDTSSSNVKEAQTNELLQTKNSFYRPNVNYIKEIKDNLKSREYRDNLLKIRASLEEKWNKCMFGNTELKKQIKFIDALLDGSINRLLVQIKKGDLKTAKKAFNQLKKAWPWQEAHINSIITGHSLQENMFIKCIEIDIMQFAKNSLMLRKDFLDERWGALSQIQSFYSEVRDSQLRGDIKDLISKREQLIKDLQNRRYADFKLTIEAKLIILDTALSNPMTQMFSTIKNANYDKASKALDDFKEQLSNHFEAHNITNKAEAKTDMIKREGVDLIAVANKCFKSRPDYQAHIAQKKTILNSEKNTTQIDSLDMVSTTISQDTLTISPESNQRIGQTLDTLNDQSLEAFSSQIDALVTMFKEQKFDAQTNGNSFALGLESYALLQKYTENPNKRIIAQQDENILIFNARKDALSFVSNNPTECREQSYTLNHEAWNALQSRGMDPEQFTYCVGNEVQQQMHAEFVSILNNIANIPSNASTQPLLDLVITCTHAGNVYEQQNNIEKAFSMADLSWAALDCAKAICDSGIDIAKTRLPEIAEGMVEGCINAIYNMANMIIHPRETIHNIRESFSHLGKCLVTLAVSVDHPEDLFTSPEINEIKVELRQEIMENIIDAASQMTFKGTVSLVTEQYVSGKIFCLGMSCLKHYADPSLAQLAKIGKAFNDKTGDRVPKLVNPFLQKVTNKLGNFTKAEHVVVTTEGAKVTVTAQKESQVLQSMDKTKGSDFSQKLKGKTSNINEKKPINSNSKDGKIVSNSVNSAIQHEAETLLGKEKKLLDQLNELEHKHSNTTKAKRLSWGLDTKNYERLLRKADEQYEKIRALTDDISIIAKNTGIPEEFIVKIKNHVFHDIHELRNGEFRRFYADANMAAAWERLIDNSFLQNDLLLLQHEYAEAIVTRGLNIQPGLAHDIINTLYDWNNSLLKG